MLIIMFVNTIILFVAYCVLFFSFVVDELKFEITPPGWWKPLWILIGLLGCFFLPIFVWWGFGLIILTLMDSSMGVLFGFLLGVIINTCIMWILILPIKFLMQLTATGCNFEKYSSFRKVRRRVSHIEAKDVIGTLISSLILVAITWLITLAILHFIGGKISEPDTPIMNFYYHLIFEKK